MMKLKFSRTKASILGMVSMFMCVMWGLAFFWAWTERDRTMESTSNILGQLKSAIEEQTKGLYRVLELSLYSSERWISSHPGSDPSRSKEFSGLLDGFRRLSDYAIDIKIVSPSGKLVNIPDTKEKTEIDISTQDYFRAQSDEKTRGFYIGRPFTTKDTKKWILPVSIPVNSENSYASVIFAAVDIERITERLEKSRIKPRGTIIVTTEDGMIMFRAPLDEKILGKSLASHPDFELCVKSENGICITDSSTTDGIKRLLSFSRSASFPLIIAVSSSMEDILDPWKKQTMIIFMVCFFVSCTVVFLWLQLLKNLKANEETRLRLEYLSRIDDLTGLLNRRAFMEILEGEMERSRRYSRPLSILLLDLDFFKKINDTHGHAAGDEMLRSTGKLFRKILRGMDVAGRMGGEEFCILLPETDAKSAREVAERIRESFSEMSIPSDEKEIRTTISIGLAELGEKYKTTGSIIEKADKGLYEAKRLGRNRVESI